MPGSSFVGIEFEKGGFQMAITIFCQLMNGMTDCYKCDGGSYEEIKIFSFTNG